MMIQSTVNAGLRYIKPWMVYLLGIAWIGWLFYLAASNQLGVNPVETLEHLYGEHALQWVILGLAITPLRRFLRINLMHLRRSIGVVTFLFVLAHILVWAVLDVQTLNAIWADLSERPYIMVGFAGFVLMVPLAISSNNLSVRKLGPLRWRRLHMLVYPAAILGAVHYVWLARGFQIEPLVYLVLITGLVALRRIAPTARLA